MFLVFGCRVQWGLEYRTRSVFGWFIGCYDIGGSDIGGSDIGGPDIGGFLATLEALSKKDIGGLVTLEAC